VLDLPKLVMVMVLQIEI